MSVSAVQTSGALSRANHFRQMSPVRSPVETSEGDEVCITDLRGGQPPAGEAILHTAARQSSLLQRLAAGLGLGLVGIGLVGCGGPSPLAQDLTTVSRGAPLRKETCRKEVVQSGPDWLPLRGRVRRCEWEPVTPSEAARLLEKGQTVKLDNEILGNAQQLRDRARYVEGSSLGASPEVARSVRTLQREGLLREQEAATALRVPQATVTLSSGPTLTLSEALQAARLYELPANATVQERALASLGDSFTWNGSPVHRVLAAQRLQQHLPVQVESRDFLQQPRIDRVSSLAQLVELQERLSAEKQRVPTVLDYQERARDLSDKAMASLEADVSLAQATLQQARTRVPGRNATPVDEQNYQRAIFDAEQKLTAALWERDLLRRATERMQGAFADPAQAEEARHLIGMLSGRWAGCEELRNLSRQLPPR